MTAMAAAFGTTRLTLRLHRFEAFAFVVLVVAGVGLAFLVGARLDAIRYDPRCYDTTGLVPVTTACQQAMNRFSAMVDGEANEVAIITTFVPFLAGLLLGTPIVGREVERGTTRLAWALSPSRQRWFLQRLIPVLVVVAGGSFLLGVAGDRLIGASQPQLDPANAFDQFGFRGVVIAARAVFVFGLAVLVGAVMGRALPAFIVAGLIAVIAIAGGSRVHHWILEREAVIMPEPGPGDLYMDQRFRLPNGTLIGWDQLEQYDPMPADPQFTGQWPTLPQIQFGIPGSRYRQVEAREVAALGGATVVSLGLAAFVVQRRRPG